MPHPLPVLRGGFPGLPQRPRDLLLASARPAPRAGVEHHRATRPALLQRRHRGARLVSLQLVCDALVRVKSEVHCRETFVFKFCMYLLI